MIVSEFLSEDKVMYNRGNFINAYQNVTQNQIFSNIQSVNKFFDTWTMQKGYPIVMVHRVGHILHFQQVVQSNYPNTQPFTIPISVITEPRAKRDLQKTHPDLWLTTAKKNKATFDLRGVAKWYLVNNQRSGYYRVQYDAWNYKLLRFELIRGDMEKIAPVTRGQLIDDAMMLGRAKSLHYSIIIELLEYLKHETDEIPWRMAKKELQFIQINLRFTKTFPLFKHFMKMLSRRFYRHMIEEMGELTPEAIKWACFGELPHCLRHTHGIFLNFLKKREVVEHLDKIICEGVKSVDDETYRYIKLFLKNEFKGLEQNLYLTALVCPDNYEYLKETLNVLFRKTSTVSNWMAPLEKARQMIKMCTETETGVVALLDFIFQHPTLVFKNLGEKLLVSVLASLAKSLYKRGHQRKIRLIVFYLRLSGTEQIFHRIQSKKRWLELYLATINKILENFEDVEVLEEYANI